MEPRQKAEQMDARPLAEALRSPYVYKSPSTQHIMACTDPKIRNKKDLVCSYCNRNPKYDENKKESSYIFSKKAKSYTKYYHIACAQEAGFDIRYE